MLPDRRDEVLGGPTLRSHSATHLSSRSRQNVIDFDGTHTAETSEVEHEATPDLNTSAAQSCDSALARVAPERGRLRTLMLTALKRYVIDQHRRDAARGRHHVISLAGTEHEEIILGDSGETSPDDLFEHRWALAVFETAMRRCRHTYDAPSR